MKRFEYVSVNQAESERKVCELKFEDIAGLESVLTSVPYFLISDNLDNETKLDANYINSIGEYIMSRPFKIRFNMIMFCISGRMDIQLNLNRFTLNPGEVLIVYEGMVCHMVEFDPDSKLFFFGFSSMFVNTHNMPYLSGAGINRLFDSPIMNLSRQDFDDMMSLYKIVKSRFSSANFHLKDQLAHSIMDTIVCILINLMSNNESHTIPLGRKQVLVRDFLSLVERHAISHRQLEYYANLLNISPKYLSQIVLDITGSTPRTLICRQVLLEAKVLLSNPTLTIQQVSDRLNFANPSFFGTFFRRQTGITPKAYKSSIIPAKNQKQ